MFRSFLLLAVVALVVFVGAAVLFGQFQHEASTGCDASAIEARLTGTDKSRHKNLCMAAAGYKRTLFCEIAAWSNQDAEICFAPWWSFWNSKAMLAE